MYEQILVPIAFGEDLDVARPLKVAQRLASRQAQITLFHVITEMPTYAVSRLTPAFVEETRQALREALDKLADGIDGASGVVSEGEPARAILEEAAVRGADLIVLGPSGRKARGLLSGSTTGQVLKSAQCAIHVVK